MKLQLLTKIVPALAVALLFLPLAAPADAAPGLAGPTDRPTFLAELLEWGAPGLAPENALLDPLMPGGMTTSPAAIHRFIDEATLGFGSADTPQEALRLRAQLNSEGALPLEPNETPGALSPLILDLYAALGETPTPAQVLDLQDAIAGLTPNQASGLAILVDAVTRAVALEALHTSVANTQAGLLLLDAAAAAEPAMTASLPALPTTGTSAASACGAPFEDPLKLIWIGTTCDDVLPNDGARILQYDPAGNDQYYDNAGGAFGSGLATQGLIDFALTSERTVDEALDNVTLGPLFPLSPLNSTWQNNTIDNFPGNVVSTIENNVTRAILNTTLFLQEFIAGVDLVLGPNMTNSRRFVPVAFHVDVTGNDLYQGDIAVQGSAVGVGGIGVLLDQAGDDAYTCRQSCQGFSAAGLGLLVDQGGSDTYSAVSFAQGVADGGILLDFGGHDTYLSTGVASQGSHYNPVPPHVIPSLLLDTSGDDTYTGGSLTQGAGGLLVDLSGTDHYTATGSNAQGVGVSETLGMLLDVSGNDAYTAFVWSQGVGHTGVGILADLSGDDDYFVLHDGQGVAFMPGGTGLLFDGAGDDSRMAKRGQGHAIQGGVGIVLDLSGDDVYAATADAQGVSDVSLVGAVGILLDADGNDVYTAGDHSQGSGGLNGGVGMLLDAYGLDTYTAGHESQGSGGSDKGLENHALDFAYGQVFVGQAPQGPERPLQGGHGVLLDGTQDQVRVQARTDIGTNEISGAVQITSPPGGPPTADTYSAGDYSQGSSGSGGGLGLLLDREDKGGQLSTFVAGSHSQGASTGNGLGALVNANGRDRYVAGPFSQGASDGGLGLLIDEEGNDVYAPSSPSDSHGYGNSTLLGNASAAIGLLIDDGGDDAHPDLDDNACLGKGEFGLAVDTVGANLPAGCSEEIVAGANRTANKLAGQLLPIVEGEVQGVLDAINALLFPAAPTPPGGTVYFYDDVEDSAASLALWTVTGGSGLPEDATGTAACLVDSPQPLSNWRIRNATNDPQLSPNAHTGSQYWYAGNLAGPAPVYGYAACSVTTLTSAAISLVGATAPELRAWIAGSSEATFDFLRVYVEDVTAGTSDMVLERDDGGLNNPLPAYSEDVVDLTPYVGHDIRLVFEFTSDAGLQEGQGYNVDDILVAEA